MLQHFRAAFVVEVLLDQRLFTLGFRLWLV